MHTAILTYEETTLGGVMDKKTIDKIQEASGQIDNFKACYKDCVLWGSSPDGDVKAEQMLAWLMEYPYMAEIAESIKKIRCS